MEPAGPYGVEDGQVLLEGPGDVTDIDSTEVNRELVRAFVKKVLVAGDVAKVDQFVAESMVGHDPTVGKGRDGLVEFVKRGVVRWERIGRVICEGNFAWAACQGVVEGVSHVLCEGFRVEGGKIVEHWRVKQPIPEQRASGLDMLLE